MGKEAVPGRPQGVDYRFPKLKKKGGDEKSFPNTTNQRAWIVKEKGGLGCFDEPVKRKK